MTRRFLKSPAKPKRPLLTPIDVSTNASRLRNSSDITNTAAQKKDNGIISGRPLVCRATSRSGYSKKRKRLPDYNRSPLLWGERPGALSEREKVV